MDRGREPIVEPFGDRALLVTLGLTVDLAINARVQRLTAALHDRAPDGLGIPVPGYASVLVPFTPERIGHDEVGRLVREELRRLTSRIVDEADESGPEIEIPVRYGGDDGPDLSGVADRLGRSEREVVALHTGTTYRVYLLGFSPGFGYLGTLPIELALPRRDEPRTRVPTGSVAIAERQTAIYPASTAGGWHLIGRTDLVLWDPKASPPARLQPGMRVRFVAV